MSLTKELLEEVLKGDFEEFRRKHRNIAYVDDMLNSFIEKNDLDKCDFIDLDGLKHFLYQFYKVYMNKE